MRVTAKVDYTVRAAIELAHADRANPVKGERIAREAGRRTTEWAGEGVVERVVERVDGREGARRHLVLRRSAVGRR